MWTNEELIEIRDRAEIEASSTEQNLIWRSACIDLAATASHLLSLSNRICEKKLTAMKNYKAGFKPSKDIQE